MKSAHFSFQPSLKNTRILRGKVTLHDDGKISVNLFDGRMASPASRYMAKQYAEKLAKEGFIDPSLTDIHEEKTNFSLIAVLKQETESLRIQYIEKCKEHAKKRFDWAQKLWLLPITERYDYFGIKWEIKKVRTYAKNGPEFVERPEIINYDNETYKRMTETLSEAKKIYLTTERIYEEKAIKAAQLHYEQSIAKLAHRIESKGLDLTKLTTKTSHVGVNIETTLTDGEKTVRAWTIIAEGEIQRPHYRYLVK